MAGIRVSVYRERRYKTLRVNDNLSYAAPDARKKREQECAARNIAPQEGRDVRGRFRSNKPDPPDPAWIKQKKGWW